MNIQSISELNGLSVGIDQLSAQSPRAFVEVSRQNQNTYDSYKLDLHVFLSSIVAMVSYLSSEIDNLNSQITAIRSNYVPLSGYVTLTGPIEINPKTIKDDDASLMVRGPLAVRGIFDIRPNDNGVGRDIYPIGQGIKYVVINGPDAQLHTSTDIDGCALSAKWC